MSQPAHTCAAGRPSGNPDDAGIGPAGRVAEIATFAPPCRSSRRARVLARPLLPWIAMWARHAPSGFGWTRIQTLWVATFAAAVAFAPARGVRAVPQRDPSGDPRPPGTWLLYEDVLEVNGAAAEDFELLPGIGPALARRLVEGRQAAGGFCGPEELAAIARIGPARWARVAPRIRVQPAPRCSASSRG